MNRSMPPGRSPLDVPGIQVDLREGETREWLRESREESAERLLTGKRPGKPKGGAGKRRKAPPGKK